MPGEYGCYRRAYRDSSWRYNRWSTRTPGYTACLAALARAFAVPEERLSQSQPGWFGRPRRPLEAFCRNRTQHVATVAVDRSSWYWAQRRYRLYGYSSAP